MPLFFSLPEQRVFASQVIIGPEGEIRLSCLRAGLVMGRSEYHERIEDPKLIEMGRRYAEAFRAAGWVGPLNLQFKRTPDGGYAGFEMNGRMSGGSCARTLMGFDEMATLVELFVWPGPPDAAAGAAEIAAPGHQDPGRRAPRRPRR